MNLSEEQTITYGLQMKPLGVEMTKKETSTAESSIGKDLHALYFLAGLKED